ncbi:MAG TPA: transcription antitermination factor NusB [Fimbriimonadaceae bacterium]|nr:transcription antitermination factor NusB [Fimbriimonadaceae bacterium]HRJ95937.1 transcription antitermination factor NusB [Fimbriimonadaceae bacterium]
MASEKTPPTIRSRRAAREAALKAAYQIRLGGFEPEAALEDVLSQAAFSEEAADFVRRLIQTLDAKIEDVDGAIKPLLSANWDYERIAEIDRAILRIACAELLFFPEIPPKATINEAVDLAKRYGAAESPRFVNGVLGSLLPLSPKADWKPMPGPDWPEDEAPTEETQVELVEEGSERHKHLVAGTWRLREADEEGKETL